MKQIICRAVVLLCVLAVALACNLSAFAGGVTGVSGVDVSLQSGSPGSLGESGGTVTVTVNSKNFNTTRQTATVVVSNTSGSTATISFDYSASNYDSNSGGFTLSDSSSGTHSVVLDAGGSITFNIRSIQFSSKTATLTLSNFSVVKAVQNDVALSFDSSLGSVTLDGTAVSAGTHSVTASTFAATAKSGTVFLGWINPDTHAIISTDASYKCAPSSAMKLHAVFASNSGSGTAWFKVDDTYLTDNLTTASTLGTKIVLANNGTLTGSHTLGEGDTLVIPCDAANTVYTTTPGHDGNSTYEVPSVYRKLTMAAGSGITVSNKAAISIGGKAGTYMIDSDHPGMPPYVNGAPSGPLGFIDMASDSSITVLSGGNLYAWGYITGSGSVTVKSGGTVYEDLQIRDYRGGDATTSLVGDDNKTNYKVFPFSQYYIQNIEVPLTLEAGAVENICMTVSVSLMGAQQSAAPYIGSSDGFIRLSSGKITKTYDGSKDRIIYDVNGDVSFANLQVSIKVSTIGTVSIESKDYTMNITNNMTLNVNGASNVTLNQDIALLPGAVVSIAKDAKVTLGAGNKLFIYDSDAWSKSYVGIVNVLYSPVYYAPGRTYDRTSADICDTELILNGTLDATNGYVYTTASGANVYSTGGGKMIIGGAASDTVTYQVIQSGTEISSYPEIPVTSIQLKNAGGTVTMTDGKSAVEYHYFNDFWHIGDSCSGGTATCAKAAVCTTCGQEYGSKLEHTPGESVIENKVEVTCVQDGSYDTVVYCTACTTQLSRVTTTTSATGEHTEVDVAAVAPTCTKTGLTAGKKCSVCGTVTVAQTEVAKLAHTEVVDAAVAATCTTTGKTEGKHCSVCNTVTVAQEETSKLSHTPGAAATCTTAQTCTECGTELTAALDHTWDNACDTTCNRGCGYAREITHTWGEVDYTWSDDNTQCTASRECSVCHITEEATATVNSSTQAPTCAAAGSTTHTASFGVSWAEAQTKEASIEATGCNWNEGVVTTDPTCTVAGVKTFTCGICGATKTEAVAALGHDEESHEAQAATCTAIGWEAYVTCSRCDYTTYKEIAALGHDMVSVEGKAATCTEDGYTAYTDCSRCDHVEGKEVLKATGHSYTSAVTTAPTCTAEGVKTFTCSACSHSYTEAIAALGHDMVTDEAKAPTCTATGLTEGSHCSRCDDATTDQEEVAALGHDMVTDAAVAPTCTATGLTEGSHCSRCDDATAAQEEVAALGHDMVTDAAVAPTCTATGLTEGSHCSRCDDATTAQETVAALGHDEESHEAKASTCDAIGWDAYVTCSRCDYSTYEEKAATGHSYGDWTTTKEATCTEDGSKQKTCSCGDVVTEAIAALGHDYDAVVTAPTCTEKGYTTYTCSCGDTYKGDEVDALGHTEVIDEAKAPTCTENGLTEGKHCSVCNEVLVAQTVVDALDHSYTESVTKQPTCTEKGVKTFICSCGDTYTEEIAATGHTLTQVAAKAPTCTEAGYEAYEYCSVCDYTTYKEVAATGHSYNSVVTAPTFEADGYTTYTCACGDSYVVTDEGSKLIAVAQIGETKYQTLAEAVEAAQAGETITLLAEVELTERLSITKQIKLDLAGNTITANFTDTFGAIYVSPNSDLTVTGNGTIVSKQDIVFANFGKITIENGTFKSEAGEDGYNAVLYNMYYSGTVYGTAVIKGGTFESEVWNSGVLTIEGGTLNGIDNSGKTTITGGTINGTIYAGDGSDAPELVDKGTIAISGGTFENEVDESWCAEGYGTNSNDDGTYGVHQHNYNSVVTAPTCTEAGYTTYTCSACGDTYTADAESATGHGQTTVTYETVEDEEKHTVTTTCNTCGEETVSATTEDCVDDDSDEVCDKCGGAVAPKGFVPQVSNGFTTAEVNSETAADGTVTSSFKVGSYSAAPMAIVTSPVGGWKEGVVTFTVASDSETASYAVIIKDAEGKLTRLKATNENGIHSYTTNADFTSDCEIIVVLKGDLNGDGRIRSNEVVQVKNAQIQNPDVSFTELQLMICDVNGDGRIRSNEVVQIKNAQLGSALTW